MIVRLRNWVGDVTLSLPLLTRLDAAGYDLRLVGKGWARELLAGHGWPVQVLGKTLGERVVQLRALRRQALQDDPAFGRRLNALCLPDSFSSALDFRLAGLRALGHANEGRSPLLGRAVARPPGQHELAVYWQLGSLLLGSAAELPTQIGLRLTALQRAQAAALREQHGLGPRYIVVCPFAGGTWSGQDKTWPAFPDFVASLAARTRAVNGPPVLICPGPGEEALARECFGTAVVLTGVGLGAYAALLADAALMVSNDTGPAHMAAAVGTPLVSVMGPSNPALWRPWGPNVQVLQGGMPGQPEWPTLAAVDSAAQATLALPIG